MKIAIMAAGNSEYFPLFFDKPKSLYHVDGKTQLSKVIEMSRKITTDDNIFVVSGYKSEKMKKYLEIFYPNIRCKINKNYNKQAVYSFRTAIDGEKDDILFVFADELINEVNTKKIANSKKSMAILYHDDFYYISLGVFKINKNKLDLFNDAKYLSFHYIKKIYCFANDKSEFDGRFLMNSGICLGYIVIDIVRRIAEIKEIKHPSLYENKTNVDFIYYDPQTDYLPDLDEVEDTDEYKYSFILRAYVKLFSKPARRIIHRIKRISENAKSR